MPKVEVAERGRHQQLRAPLRQALPARHAAEMLVDVDKHKAVEGITPEQVAKMQRRWLGFQKELKSVEESHGSEALNL